MQRDCFVLGMACVRYFKTLHDLTHVNVLESGKMTAASLAAAAAQKQLIRGKFPGQFCINSSFLYGLMRKSAIGALCTVMRTESGKGGPPINSHLENCLIGKEGEERERRHPEEKEEEEEKEELDFDKEPLFCHMLDVNSLYPSSW